MTPDPSPYLNSVIHSQGSTWLAVELFQSKKLFRLKPNCDGGIILQKRFYTELISPGSALGGTIDTAITGVFAFGSIQISEPHDPIERQQAFQCRLNQSQRLQHLMQEQSELKRTCLLLQQLQDLVGASDIGSIPTDLMGQLIGLSAKRIEAIRSIIAGSTPQQHKEQCTP